MYVKCGVACRCRTLIGVVERQELRFVRTCVEHDSNHVMLEDRDAK